MNLFKPNIYKQIYKKIKKADTIIIARHVGPDPDALGSSLGLKQIILDNFKDKKVYVIGSPAAKFRYIGELDKLPENFENALLIVTDTPDHRRVDGIDPRRIKNSIKIDHHPFVETTCALEWIDDKASSASQMILEFAIKTHLKITTQAAEKIYIGIIADTNRFMFSYTNYKTFNLVSNLLKQTNIDITKQGVKDVGHQVRELGAVYEFEKMTYPDFIRRLQDSTGLLRKTIIEIVSKSGRLSEFYINPEEWIKQVSKILLSVKKENLTDGIKYEKVNEYYEQDFIFNDEELYGYKDRNILDVSSEKNIYDHVIYDSEIEREFAIDAENDDDVILYAKLPSRFKIDTPIGNYNPDWAVVLNTDEGEKLYFVAETKGTENINDLKGSEKKKILCGRKHFEVIDTGIKYEVVKELKTLKQSF